MKVKVLLLLIAYRIFLHIGYSPTPLNLTRVSELEKDLLVAMDCTTQRRVDAVQGESEELLLENQDCGVEAIFPHVRVASRREGTCSAPPNK